MSRWMTFLAAFAFLASHSVRSAPDLAPAPGAWRTEPSMHHARAAHAVVASPTTIDALAGTGARDAPVLRRAAGVTPRPSPRGGHAAVVLNGRIHVIGGGNSRSTIADHDVYDPATNRWTSAAAWRSAPPLPTARNFARAVPFRDRVFVVGGSPTPGRSHASEGSAIVESFGLRCP